MKNNPKFNILEKMVYNQTDYFDKDVCLFLLKSITTPTIKTKEIQNKSIKNFNISTTLWGQIIYENKNLYRNEKIENNHSRMCQENKAMWENILNSIDKDITQNPFYTLTKAQGIQKDKKYDVTINGILALTEPDFWFTLYQKNPEKYGLNKTEKYVLAEDLIEAEQQYYIHSNNIEFKSYLLANVVENLPQLKNKFKNDEEFTSKILKSQHLKKLLRTSQTEEIAPLFSTESLSSIIKKANLSENLASYVNMLSDFMPIAPAQSWIDAFSNDKKFSLTSFMNPLLNKACGISQTELTKRITNNGLGIFNDNKPKTHRSAANEAFLRLDYISDALQDIKLNELSTMTWYAAIMESGNRDLFKKSLSLIDFPKKTEKNEYFFKTWYNKPVDTIVGHNVTGKFNWSDIEKEYHKEKLENQLSAKPEKIKSPKI